MRSTTTTAITLLLLAALLACLSYASAGQFVTSLEDAGAPMSEWSGESPARYDGHQVLRMLVRSERDVEAIMEAKRRLRLDLWTSTVRPGAAVDVRCPPSAVAEVRAMGIPHEVFVQDVQALIEASEADNLWAQANGNGSFFDSYHSYTKIVDYLNTLATTYPTLAQVITIGNSSLGLSTVAIQITGKGAASQKPGFVFNGGIHAREWITGASVTFIANQLLSLYNQDPEVTKLVDGIQWTLVPVANPDGYEYTRTGDRMWRKNRRQLSAGCVGVDNNRNWDSHWEAGSDCTDDEYPGPAPFSEAEDLNLANLIQSLPNTAAYMDIHSYSQLWMYPYGFTSKLPPQNALLKSVSEKAVAAIQATHGQKYTQGNIYTTIYAVAGDSVDWTFINRNITLSFAVELRDTGTYGFVLPAKEIIPQGEELMAAMRVVGEAILSPTQ